MKLVIDKFMSLSSDELKEFLLMQDGIYDVKTEENDSFIVLDITHDIKITPELIIKYIEMTNKFNYSMLFEFDKGTTGNFKIFKYTIDDVCCEYCYRDFIMDLFENKKIKSVKSNFDYSKTVFNIEFIIEYDEKYSEKELIEYIEEKK